MDENELERINDWIMEILDEDDDERRVLLADNVLDLDPDNPVAKYVKWQSFDDDEESIHDTLLLEEAIAALRPKIERLDRNDELEATVYSMYLCMLSDLASSYYMAERHDMAYGIASEFMELDDEYELAGRIIYYAALIERGDFDEVLEAADKDNCETPSSEYCKAIASFELGGINEDAALNLLNAFSLDPDLAFYITGIWDLDETIMKEDEEPTYLGDMMMTASILSELWNASEERLAFLTVFAFAFGYITGRIGDSAEAEIVEKKFRENGYIEELEEARDVLQSKLARGSDPQEIDEEALAAIQEADYFGLLDD
ncbi:MAG: hypothetical protein LBU13_10440 [Synergistaceae bacterium]|jgi:hypothetical protein|nr:hypothetical protein [Synergistaceae bacterium]